MSDVREGDADARYKLFFFFNGGCLFVSMADVREGDADALYELASRYFRGDGVEKSEMKAFELLEDTIKSDGAHAAAINDLAVLFCQGICILLLILHACRCDQRPCCPLLPRYMYTCIYVCIYECICE